MIVRTITVELADRSYPIYVGRDLVAQFAAVCTEHALPPTLTVITDRNVGAYHLQPLLRSLTHQGYHPIPIVIPPGESQKSLRRAAAIFTEMLSRGVGRSSAVVALGGGVVGDLSGFVAATYQRGVPLVQVPTSLLSQVDSSIGGKTAVNHALGKNMVGAFYQPKFVWTDMFYLRTLPRREVMSGLGEIIKYAVIRDAALFEYLEQHLDAVIDLEEETVAHVQSTCSALKAGLVSADEREQGIRVVLNFGHTVGHALEAAGHYRMLRHGEGVLLGMLAESRIAFRLGLIDRATEERIAALIARVPLHVNRGLLRIPAILTVMGRDKKTIASRNRFVLPTRIGDVTVVEHVDRELIRESLRLVLSSRPPRRT